MRWTWTVKARMAELLPGSSLPGEHRIKEPERATEAVRVSAGVDDL
jgi:hypothetical protein